jgi:FtsP/CotA-like multicopper oxidase with cupredoxin domain
LDGYRKSVCKEFIRREFLGAGAILCGTSGAVVVSCSRAERTPSQANHDHQDAMAMTVGEVDHQSNGFNPTDILTDFDYGQVSTLENGQTLREYEIYSTNKDVEVAPGIEFPAWVYNGRIPGPTIRCTEGDRIRIHFRNASTHPHSMHFHGIHTAEMDGVPGTPGVISPGMSFTYEFDAEPFGLHLYHCHAFPLARHIAKGLYGTFIIDPKEVRPAVDREFVMVMSGFDVDFDDENDFYAVNAIPFHYQLNHPIDREICSLVNIRNLVINYSICISAFLLSTGTSLIARIYRHVVKPRRAASWNSLTFPGLYMFHAHNTEFAELGWTGNFEVIS